jgi:hypothetical protein
MSPGDQNIRVSEQLSGVQYTRESRLSPGESFFYIDLRAYHNLFGGENYAQNRPWAALLLNDL